jgi:uncharacterized protein
VSAPEPLVANVLSVAIEHEPVAVEQRVIGAPTTGWTPLVGFGGTEIGVWEMTPGAVTDTEADEVFCVLAGHGLVEFLDPPAAPLELVPGALVRLQAGWRTRWTVTETLRKIAVTEGEDPT